MRGAAAALPVCVTRSSVRAAVAAAVWRCCVERVAGVPSHRWIGRVDPFAAAQIAGFPP